MHDILPSGLFQSQSPGDPNLGLHTYVLQWLTAFPFPLPYVMYAGMASSPTPGGAIMWPVQ
jgi:hypothetical protein